MRYEPITPEILKKLEAVAGPKNVVTDPDKMQPYSHDEVTDPAYHHMPEAVVFAETAEQVAAVVQLANDYHFPVVPRGAGTGLACGAVPIYGGVVLSLEKMNRILEINEDALYAVVEPGVRTSDLQDAAEAKGLFYAGDPCSGDSCFIGGNIATNAGGNRAVKYGTTRHQVYDVEIVNPTGRIVNRQSDGPHRPARRPPAEAIDRLLPRAAGHRLGRHAGHHHQGNGQAPAEAKIRSRSPGRFRFAGTGHRSRRSHFKARHRPDLRRIHGQYYDSLCRKISP